MVARARCLAKLRSA